MMVMKTKALCGGNRVRFVSLRIKDCSTLKQIVMRAGLRFNCDVGHLDLHREGGAEELYKEKERSCGSNISVDYTYS